MPFGPGEVLQLLRDGQAHTRADLLELTGLSRMTVAQRVDGLLAAGLIREAGVDRAPRGRRPTRLEFNVAHSVVVALLVDTTHARTALTDLSGTVLVERQIDLTVDDGPERVLSALASASRELLATPGLTTSTVSGVGVSVPGPVDPATYRPSQPPIMPGWDAYPVVEHLQDTFPVPVLVQNDADAMALGEASDYPHCRSLYFVKVSTGIGTGIVIDGRIYQGIDGGAGDIGHVRLTDHGDALCQCGAVGCLAAVASGRAVARALNDAGVKASSVCDVQRLLASGDVHATRLTQEAGRAIGRVLAITVSVLNPGVLLIGGELASSALLAGVREMLYPLSLPRATRHLDIRMASRGEDAGINGLTRMVVDEVFSPRAVDAMMSS